MLTEDQIRLVARQQGKPAGVIDKDYALEWLLYGIFHRDSRIRENMVLKGGTAIRKVFFPKAWRFSEDLDFTISPEADPEAITSGFEEVCDILEDESGIRYEGEINVPSSGRAILGFVHFTGPLGMKNKIKIDASRVERMAEAAAMQTVTASYADLEDFVIMGYSLNEVISEKIRSMMQRSKVRDYYDVWKMLGADDCGFDALRIGSMVRQKCVINGIEYNPAKIFDPERLEGLGEHWEKELRRLAVEDLPGPDRVFDDMKGLLGFLPAE